MAKLIPSRKERIELHRAFNQFLVEHDLFDKEGQLKKPDPFLEAKYHMNFIAVLLKYTTQGKVRNKTVLELFIGRHKVLLEENIEVIKQSIK